MLNINNPLFRKIIHYWMSKKNNNSHAEFNSDEQEVGQIYEEVSSLCRKRDDDGNKWRYGFQMFVTY